MTRAIVLATAILVVGLAWWAAGNAPPFGHPGPFIHCVVTNNNATALTAVGAPCAAPGTGLSIYITSITASASVVATTTTDQYLSVKSGTTASTACDTSTATVWTAYNLAFAPIHAAFPTAIKVGPNKDLCWMHAATGSKSFVIDGYIAQ